MADRGDISYCICLPPMRLPVDDETASIVWPSSTCYASHGGLRIVDCGLHISSRTLATATALLLRTWWGRSCCVDSGGDCPRFHSYSTYCGENHQTSTYYLPPTVPVHFLLGSSVAQLLLLLTRATSLSVLLLLLLLHGALDSQCFL